MAPRLEHLILIRTLASERQAPLVERIEDLLDLIEATSAALPDHAEHLDHRLLSHLTQRLTDVQGNIEQAAVATGAAAPKPLKPFWTINIAKE